MSSNPEPSYVPYDTFAQSHLQILRQDKWCTSIRNRSLCNLFNPWFIDPNGGRFLYSVPKLLLKLCGIDHPLMCSFFSIMKPPQSKQTKYLMVQKCKRVHSTFILSTDGIVVLAFVLLHTGLRVYYHLLRISWRSIKDFGLWFVWVPAVEFPACNEMKLAGTSISSPITHLVNQYLCQLEGLQFTSHRVASLYVLFHCFLGQQKTELIFLLPCFSYVMLVLGSTVIMVFQISGGNPRFTLRWEGINSMALVSVALVLLWLWWFYGSGECQSGSGDCIALVILWLWWVSVWLWWLYGSGDCMALVSVALMSAKAFYGSGECLQWEGLKITPQGWQEQGPFCCVWCLHLPQEMNQCFEYPRK